MYKNVALLMVGVALVACGGEAPQSSPKDVQLAAVRRAPTPPSIRGSASLVSTPDALSLGTIPLQTRGANGVTTGALASVAATVTNTSSSWTSGALTVSLDGSPEIVKGNASCTDQDLAASGSCQDSYMLDCTGAATEGVKTAVVTVSGFPVAAVTTTFSVSGTCAPAATGAALIAFTPTSMDFGSVSQDSCSAVQKLTLGNTGSGATNLLGAPVIHASSEFTIDTTKCTGASLAMGDICAVNVYLDCGATTPGTKTGSVTYTAPNGGSVATATFSGECVAVVSGAGCSLSTDCASGICDPSAHTCI